MRAKFYVITAIVLVMLSSCELDNYNEPDSILTGNLTHNNEAIPVARNQVRFQLWQSGYGTPAPIDVSVGQDGSFSSRLFSGNYKLVFLPGEGPFIAPADTLYFDLSGSKKMDLSVTPYYMISNAQFSHSSGVIRANCSLNQVITGLNARPVERVSLVINRTMFVDANSGSEGSIAQVDAENILDLNNITMTVEIPNDPKKPNQDYIFARVGVKVLGVEDMIYTQVEKIPL